MKGLLDTFRAGLFELDFDSRGIGAADLWLLRFSTLLQPPWCGREKAATKQSLLSVSGCHAA
jgi:hypothetical protein